MNNFQNNIFKRNVFTGRQYSIKGSREEPLNAWMLTALVGKSWFPGKRSRTENRGSGIKDRGSGIQFFGC